jgi:ribonuclease HI
VEEIWYLAGATMIFTLWFTFQKNSSREFFLHTALSLLHLDSLSVPYVEIAPDDWRDNEDEDEITIKFRVDRPAVASLNIVMMGTFRLQYKAMIPVFMDTDGACAGNPGHGEWGYILAQQDCYTAAYGAKANASNNEIKLQDIDEGLKFFTKRTYVIIESDSQNCIKTMTDGAKRWEADNWCTLKGKIVKNQQLAENITTRLWMVNVTEMSGTTWLRD